MQSFLAVKNDTDFPAISVYTDGNPLFYDILKGDTSPFLPLNTGSTAFSVYNNFGRLIFDRWISVPPVKKLIISVSSGGLVFI